METKTEKRGRKKGSIKKSNIQLRVTSICINPEEDFGKQVRKVRELYNMSLRELCGLTGLNVTRLSNFENNSRGVHGRSFKTLSKYCQGLGITRIVFDLTK